MPPAPPAEPRDTPAGGARTVLDAWLAASALNATTSADAPTRPIAPEPPLNPTAGAPAQWPAGAPAAPAATRATVVLKPPLRQRLVGALPLLAVIVVAAALGAIIGMPGSEEAPPPTTARSPDAGPVAKLDEVRLRVRDELALAATPEEQASAAQRLAKAHEVAADAVQSADVKTAAEKAATAYSALAAAAQAEDEDAFRSAKSGVDSADAALSRALGSR